jgi:V8-like Glu-specific endopeptidase
LMPLEAQGEGVRVAKSVPAVGDTVEITGYGVDSGSANQTQQFSSGPIKSVTQGSSRITYQADTEGGNSGSAVLSGGRGVAIHTNGGCFTNGRGANSGTLYTNNDLKDAFKRVCGAAQ